MKSAADNACQLLYINQAKDCSCRNGKVKVTGTVTAVSADGTILPQAHRKHAWSELPGPNTYTFLGLGGYYVALYSICIPFLKLKALGLPGTAAASHHSKGIWSLQK
ncbi:hypothetical protein ABBQ32_006441 [Trebouxia sp. C0010 RCD-2024]